MYVGNKQGEPVSVLLLTKREPFHRGNQPATRVERSIISSVVSATVHLTLEAVFLTTSGIGQAI